MATRKLVFLSDIHIGTNQPVNWYQKDVHEPYLQAALQYIHDNADEIDELIIIGDLVDLWTYLPDQPPATFQDVVAANPGIFAPKGVGALAQVLTKLGGRVSFMNGNHDMTVTQADLDTVDGKAGQTIGLVDQVTYEPKGGLGQVTCLHGHVFSVFCAPDPLGFGGQLPIGYFVTRLAAQWDHKQLKENYPPGSTVADMPNTGTPTGWGFNEKDVERLLAWVTDRKGNFADLVFDIIIGSSSEKHKKQTFVMPDGSKPNAYDLAKGPYSSTYDEWADRADKDHDFYGELPGPAALECVDLNDSLLHFADILGTNQKVIVMGHTHVPEDKVTNSGQIRKQGKYLYVNCGFNCPSKPDMAQSKNPKHPTFVELEIEDTRRCKALVRYVEKKGDSYSVAPKALEEAEIAF